MILNIIILLISFIIICLVIIKSSPKIITYFEEHFKDI